MRREELLQEEMEVRPRIFETPEDDKIVEMLGFYGLGGEYDLGADDDDEFSNASANPIQCFTTLCRTRKAYYKDVQSGLYQKYKKSMSRRKAKKKSRKEANDKAWKKYPKVKLKDNLKAIAQHHKDQLGKGAKAVGNLIKKGALATPRVAYLSLLAINYRGWATKGSYSTKKAKDKMSAKWKKLGGTPSKLWSAMDKGKKKKPFFCGKKCKKKIKDAKNFTGDGLSTPELIASLRSDQYYAHAEPVTATVVATWVGIASTVSGAIAKFFTPSKEAKETGDGTPVPPVKPPTTPEDEIKNNPNLTPEEKKAGLNALNEATGGGWQNYALWGGIGLLVLTGAYLVFRKK